MYFLFLYFFPQFTGLFIKTYSNKLCKKFSDKFYLFDDPIFINPDSYNILNNIKENITKSSNFMKKLLVMIS